MESASLEVLLEEVLEIKRSKRLKGTALLPGDSQLGFQALLLAALAEGPTRLENLPDSPWFRETLEDFARLGYAQQALDGHWLIHGGRPGGAAAPPAGTAEGSSATASQEPLRVRHEVELLTLAGFLAATATPHANGSPRPLAIDTACVGGDALELAGKIFRLEVLPDAESPEPSPPEAGEANASPREIRVAVARGLTVAGLNYRASARPGAAAGSGSGGLRPADLGWDEPQAKLALLAYHLAAGKELELVYAKGGSDSLETLAVQFGAALKVERNEFPEGDELARRIARQMRAAGKQEPQTRLHLGSAPLKPQSLSLPGDVTLASAFCLAATLLKGSDLALESVLLNPSRAGFIAALRRMGADIEVVSRRERSGDTLGTLRVRPADLLGKRFGSENFAGMRDEIFLLMVAAAFAEGETILRDIGHLRLYREDLLKSFAADLKGAGVEIGEIEDGLVIRGRSDYDGHRYRAQGHPSLALACLVMGMKSHGTSSLEGAECLEGRYPGLPAQLAALAAGDKP